MSKSVPSDYAAFSHLDEQGQARMVDVSTKAITRREAGASCRVLMAAETVARLGKMPKGDAVAVARLAGIAAAKKVDELIPLAHTLNLDHIDLEITPLPTPAGLEAGASRGGVEIRSRVVVTARTGAELEALVACAHAALALYDMVKAVDRGAVITDLQLDQKSGGRSGDYRRDPNGGNDHRGAEP